jgi:hypothetical protein
LEGKKKTLRKRVEVDFFFCKNRGRIRFLQTKSDCLSRERALVLLLLLGSHLERAAELSVGHNLFALLCEEK